MKSIQKDELYRHLGQFLKTKGIELQEGSYSRRIQQGCNLLADAINLSQKGFAKARAEVDHGLTRMREVIHEKTAPKPAGAKPGAAQPAAPPAAPRRKGARARPSAKRAKRG